MLRNERKNIAELTEQSFETIEEIIIYKEYLQQKQ